MGTETTTFKNNPRGELGNWVRHELNFFPGIQKLDKLLFTTSFAQIPKTVALLPYDPATNDILTAEQPFGKTNSARHSNVRIDMASRYDPYRNITFTSVGEGDNPKPAQVIQAGVLNNGVSLVAKSEIDVDKTTGIPQGKTKLQTILLTDENEAEIIEIKLRMDPDKKQVWYDLPKLQHANKKSVNIHLEEMRVENDDTIYVVNATIDGKNVLLPIPQSVIPYERFTKEKRA